ncbi:hypothetical protein NDU88_003451 [Pleurodeles waltl]|uniref:Uncharacterized protein n=1 Tax=Pleurodeles waltl TaxID=8319 RepID=A0AAV7SEJ0_PLEWA|nr:hypothetical protein NDU88_003451 [Pleurodeles waltl]
MGEVPSLYEGLKARGRGQATKHGGSEQLELRAAISQNRLPEGVRGHNAPHKLNRSCGDTETAWARSGLPVTRINGSVPQPNGSGLKTGPRGGGHAGREPTGAAGAARRNRGDPGSHLLTG